MGTSGIIPDEYWDGLATLRERLCLSEEAAMGVFSTEVTVKMKTFGQKALDAMEEKGSSNRPRRRRASAGKMGIEDSQITTEVLNLVEFAEASKALVYEEEGGKEVAKVGASCCGQFDSRDLKNLYRQYLVEAFSGNDAAQNKSSSTTCRRRRSCWASTLGRRKSFTMRSAQWCTASTWRERSRRARSARRR